MPRLAVITCYFNFAGFSRPQQNLHRFLRQQSKEGMSVFGIEAILGATMPATTSYARWKRVRLDPKLQMVWQKEALLNMAEKLVPEEYDWIAWVDADLMFERPLSIPDTDKDIYQLFDTAIWTAKNGRSEMQKPSSAAFGFDPSWTTHPGFAWAMRRSLWKKAGGLYPYALSGGGDSVMACAFLKQHVWGELKPHLGTNHEPYLKWATNFTDAKVGYVPQNVWHEWHGTMQDRDYVGRKERVSKVDVTKDLAILENGTLSWTPNATPELIQDVRSYFASRREDG